MVNPELLKTVALLGVSIVVVPLFKRFGLGTVLGYLVAGLLLGPSVAGLFQDPASIVHMAELGVVMFLFIIGLEMHPERLWRLRKAIFGRGLLQVVSAGALLTLAGHQFLHLTWEQAFVVGAGFSLSSTAIVMQVLDEKGLSNTAGGQRIISTLLFEDLAIVPLLASIALLAPEVRQQSESQELNAVWLALVAVLFLIASGRWLINPIFRMLSRAKVRELMTAAALLVVLGAALMMEWGGLSMAMGAFVAGVMLSESSFRHQIEADIEPFRGLLLGLFFMGVGMSLDLKLVLNDYQRLLTVVAIYVLGKALAIYLVGLITGVGRKEALSRMLIMMHGGEFAFVLFANAAGAKVIDEQTQALFTAAIIISMLLSPLWLLLKRFMSRQSSEAPNLEGVDLMGGEVGGRVLVLGFGRFNQIVCQTLLARGIEVYVIDNNVERIRNAARFGFKVYYGDGSRLDILQSLGLDSVNCVVIGIGNADVTARIAEDLRHHHPHLKILARTHDRLSAIRLIKAQVDYPIRETLESAFALSRQALIYLGADENEADELVRHIRHLDEERLQEEVLSGLSPELVRRYWYNSPLVKPQQEGEALNKRTETVLDAET